MATGRLLHFKAHTTVLPLPGQNERGGENEDTVHVLPLPLYAVLLHNASLHPQPKREKPVRPGSTALLAITQSHPSRCSPLARQLPKRLDSKRSPIGSSAAFCEAAPRQVPHDAHHSGPTWPALRVKFGNHDPGFPPTHFPFTGVGLIAKKAGLELD